MHTRERNIFSVRHHMLQSCKVINSDFAENRQIVLQIAHSLTLSYSTPTPGRGGGPGEEQLLGQLG